MMLSYNADCDAPDLSQGVGDGELIFDGRDQLNDDLRRASLLQVGNAPIPDLLLDLWTISVPDGQKSQGRVAGIKYVHLPEAKSTSTPSKTIRRTPVHQASYQELI